MSENLDRINAFHLDEIIKWRDCIWGLGQVALEFLTDRHVHQEPSSHFITVTMENVDELLPPGE